MSAPRSIVAELQDLAAQRAVPNISLDEISDFWKNTDLICHIDKNYITKILKNFFLVFGLNKQMW